MGLQSAQVTQMPDENKRLYILRVHGKCQGLLLEDLGNLILPGQGSTWGLFLIKVSPYKRKEMKMNI